MTIRLIVKILLAQFLIGGVTFVSAQQSMQDRTGIDNLNLGQQLKEPQTQGNKIIQQPGFPIALERPINPNQYIVGPGDKFSIYVQSSSSAYYDLVVSPTGELMIPNVGSVPVVDLTLSRAKKQIEKKIQSEIKLVKLGITLSSPRIIKVYLAGAVQNPGVYNVYYTSRISDVLDHSQQSLLFQKPSNIELISGSDTTQVNYDNYLYKGNMDQNPILKSGDIIFVEETNPGVSVTGFVKTPGVYPYVPGFTYLDYVSLAGGELPQGDAQRYILTGKNFLKKTHNSDIKPGDHIYVPRSKIHIWIGEISVLQIVTSVASITLAFIAATRRLN